MLRELRSLERWNREAWIVFVVASVVVVVVLEVDERFQVVGVEVK